MEQGLLSPHVTDGETRALRGSNRPRLWLVSGSDGPEFPLPAPGDYAITSIATEMLTVWGGRQKGGYEELLPSKSHTTTVTITNKYIFYLQSDKVVHSFEMLFSPYYYF